MYETKSTKQKLILFASILGPILVTQLSMFLMSFFDTVMSGRAGAADLAGVAIGSSIWMPIFTGINGVLLAITPIIAHLIGANTPKEIPKKIQQAIYLSIALALFILIVGAFSLKPILQFMDIEPSVYHTAFYYLIALSTGIIPLFIFNTIRSFIDALGQTRISMFIILISLPVNIVLNYIFIFGKFGVPAFGGIGAGIATTLTYYIVCFISLYVVHTIAPFRVYHIFSDFERPSLTVWWEQLKIGIPIGAAVFFETSIFAAITLFMSVYSTYTIAAHQAAINFSSLLYMIPLSVGMALTIAVGYEAGAKRYYDAKTYGTIGLISGIFIAIFAGFVLYIFNDFVASLYSNNQEVVELTKQFIYYAIVFQIADAFGAPLQGALRGYKDVNVTFVLALVSYWIIGLPSGWLLANYTDLGPFGYWVGLIIGLSAGAIALFYRLMIVQKRNLQKLEQGR